MAIKKYRDTHKEEQKEYQKKWRSEHQEKIKNYRLDHKEKTIEYRKEYRKTHSDEIAVRQKDWYEKHREDKFFYNKAVMLLKNYGITYDEYITMFEQQDGYCAICGIHQSELKQALCVDHNHKTGIVRGLLCNACNTLLGNAKDDPEILNKSIQYLQLENSHASA